MRKFENYEMFKTKCPVCGCKNKLHTELLNTRGKMIGYTIKCCNCGYHGKFITEHDKNGKPIVQPPFIHGKQRCIQLSFCPNKDCPLYGTCDVNLNDTDFKEHRNSDDLDYNSTLDIHVVNKPKFL